MKTQTHSLLSRSIVTTALALLAISAQAQTTVTWDGGGVGGTALLTPANWSGDAVPSSTGSDGNATRQDAQWNNTVTGPLNLTYDGATGFGGGSGVGLVMTSAQTSALTITNSSATTGTFRLISSAANTTGGIQIASGAGAFTLGAAGTANAIALRLGSTLNAPYYFNNNSSNTATIHENVTISRGGGGQSNLNFGAGTWDVKGVIAIATSGYVSINTGSNVTLSGSNTFDTPLYLNGGTLNFSAANNLGTNTSTPIRLGYNTTATLRYTGAGDTTLTRQVTIGSTDNTGFNPTIDASGNGTLSFGNATFNVTQNSTATRTLVLLGTNTGNNTISGTIANNTGVVRVQKQGVGTWVLGGNNTFSGNLYVDNGTLSFSALNNLGTNTAAIRIGEATTSGRLLYAGASDTTITRQVEIGSVNTGAGAAIIDASGSGTLSFSNAAFNAAVGTPNTNTRTLILQGTNTGNNTISGAIINNTAALVNVQKLGTGTWILGGNNTFSGKLFVDNGTLAFSAANNLGTNAAEIRVGQAATTGRLLYTGAGDTTISRQILVGSGGVGGSIIDASGSSTGALTFSAANFNLADAAATSTRTLYLTGSNTAQNTINGVIANNTVAQLVRVQKQGTGTWVLGGNNTFGGNLYVDNGTLSFSALNNLGTNAAAIRIGDATTSGKLLYTGAADTTIARQVEIGSTNVGAGSAIVDSSGNGTLSFSNAAFNSAVGTISNTRALWLQGSNTGNNTVAGVIANNTSGVVNLAKYGAGKWILTGNNTYTGTTQVNAGTLLVNNTVGSGLGAGTVDVGTTGKLGGTGTFTAAVNINSGGTLSPGASIETLGSGALTFNNSSAFEYEVNSSVATSVGADLQKVVGNLALNGTVTLTLTDLAASPVAFADTTKFTLINYSGAWNNGLFTYAGNAIANGGTFTAGLNTWQLDYDALTGGSNFSGEYAGGNFVNITAVPEPTTWALLAASLAVVIVFRRRLKHS